MSRMVRTVNTQNEHHSKYMIILQKDKLSWEYLALKATASKTGPSTKLCEIWFQSHSPMSHWLMIFSVGDSGILRGFRPWGNRRRRFWVWYMLYYWHFENMFAHFFCTIFWRSRTHGYLIITQLRKISRFCASQKRWRRTSHTNSRDMQSTKIVFVALRCR